MADNGTQDNRRNGHDQAAICAPDELLVCEGCYGKGRHYDRWGSWDCGLCHGLGYLTRAFWDTWVESFPPHIQAHIRNQPGPLACRKSGDTKKTTSPLAERGESVGV